MKKKDEAQKLKASLGGFDKFLNAIAQRDHRDPESDALISPTPEKVVGCITKDVDNVQGQLISHFIHKDQTSKEANVEGRNDAVGSQS